MTKVSVDIDYIKEGLKNIGYEISDLKERDNNGKNWQFKFANSGAIVTVYDNNNMNNSVVNGRAESEEKEALKQIVDSLKAKDLIISPLNSEIVNLIKSNKEDYYYDFKREFYENKADFLHDILCLSNNTENKDAYLIIGVTDEDHQVVGVDKEIKSNDIFDFIKEKEFAGDRVPEIEVFKMYYTYKPIYVIKCKSSKNVPFYLEKNYRDVCAYQIYTRTGDTNTPKNKQANYCDVEKLWQIHFEREND